MHLGHTVFTFYAFHWVKGTPGLDESGQVRRIHVAGVIGTRRCAPAASWLAKART